MTDLVQFVPRAERDAKENLAEFIRLARDELTAFGGANAWDSDRWQHGQTVVVFATKTAFLGSYEFTPMAEPFRQFAKAYVRYRYSHKPVKSLAMMIQALRCIEAGLIDACGFACMELMTGATMDVSAQKCREFYESPDVRHKTGLQMQAVFDFVREKRLVPSLPQWKSPFKKPVILTEDLGLDGKAHRQGKLPSNDVMLKLADLFAQADDVESRYFTSIMILLMATPSRISEVLRLPTDCIQWEPDNSGTQQMFLRWRAAKGKGAMKKWVVPAMHDIVQEAVRRLLEIGGPAREAARFANEHPGRFMPHPGCLVDPNLAPDRPLYPDEFCAALSVEYKRGGRKRDGLSTWSNVQVKGGLEELIKKGLTSYTDLANYTLETYRGSHWPYIDDEKSVLTWNALRAGPVCLYS